MNSVMPASWYTDPDVAARERSLIFARNWALFGPEHEVAKPGQWRGRCLNGWPILVARGGDGTLRAFHDACRHRGALIAGERTGKGDALRCPYHGWTYRLDGSLALAPRFKPDELGAARDGLLPVALGTWRGLVFIRVSVDGPELIEWLGSIPALCAAFPTEDMDYHGDFAVEGAANWKTYCDNTVEGYHLPHIHPTLSAAVEPASVAIEPHDGGRCIAFHVAYRSSGASMRGRGGLWFYRFPGFQATLSANAFKAERIEPLGPGHLRSTSWQWFRSLGASARAEAFAWARAIVEEDLGVCTGVQRNMAAGAFDRAVLSSSAEPNVALFQGLVRSALEAA